MKKSLAITTIITLHAAVISMLLVQSGCTEEPPAKASGQVTEIASAETAHEEEIKEPKEIVPPEGSPALRSDPTRPNWNTDDDQGYDENENNQKAEAEVQGEAVAPAPAPAPIEPAKTQPKKTDETAGKTYVVKKGDNLSKIASRTGVTVAELCRENNISTKNILRIGQKLSIPGGESLPVEAAPAGPQNVKPEKISKELELYTVQRGDSLSRIAYRKGSTVARLMSINSLKNHNIRIGQKLYVEKIPAGKEAQAKSADGEILHTVKSGEYLGSIAHKYSVSIKELCRLNSITDPRKLMAGQVLKIRTARQKDAARTQQKKEAPKDAQTPENRPPKPDEAKPGDISKQSAESVNAAPGGETGADAKGGEAKSPTGATDAAQPSEPADEDNIPVVNL